MCINTDLFSLTAMKLDAECHLAPVITGHHHQYDMPRSHETVPSISHSPSVRVAPATSITNVVMVADASNPLHN